jgi:hypothetical protein
MLGYEMYNISSGGEYGDTFTYNPNKEEIREKYKNKRYTNESKKRISDSLKGKKFSDEHKKRISEAKKGIRTNVGKKFSDQHKKNLSEAHKGIKQTDEAKLKISKNRKGCIPWNKGIKTNIVPWNKKDKEQKCH